MPLPFEIANLQDGGQMGALVRSHDWASTVLGPPAGWPASLTSALALCLDSAFPIAIYWGPDLALLYNDAWRPILGDKHPWALGKPARAVWPEIWDAIEPVFAGVRQERKGVFIHDGLLAMHRHGYVEECYFDYTFNPIRDAAGDVAGIFNVVAETTYRVINERRGGVLRDFAARMAVARTTDEVVALAVQALAGAALDVPFAGFFRHDNPAAPVVHVGSTLGSDAPWPLQEPATSQSPVVLRDVPLQVGSVPSIVWPESIREAALLPVLVPGWTTAPLTLVAAASPRRALDEEYLQFFATLTSHVATAFANAEAYEAQRVRTDALVKLDRAKSAFFSNVSHELRTPLTLMLGPVTDLLEGPGALDPHVRVELERAQRNGQRLLKLVNSLLDFSRLEAGRAAPTFEPVDLATLTTDLASGFRAATERAGLALVVDFQPLSEPVFVDRDMWERIVLNLLSNAFKFTLAGEIRLTMRASGSQLTLAVSDTGIGIPPAHSSKVFERFHRVEGAQGRSHEGSGIGLAMVQELVRLHGGSIDLESVEGEGSTFSVRLPLGSAHLPADRVRSTATASTSTSSHATAWIQEAMHWLPEGVGTGGGQPSPETGHHGLGRARIVLADDNADMRQYIARVLSRHQVIAVADGAQALDEVRRTPCDLVLSDVMMPGLDGFGLLAALRQDPSTAAVQVILVSARAGDEASAEARALGADDYLVKPFSARELQARVEAQLALKRVRQEAVARERQLRVEAETLNAVAMQLVSELDLQSLVQKVTDAATTLTGASFGAFFYNVTNTSGESYQLFTLSGAPRAAFERFGMPRNTDIFAPTFRGDAPVRLDDVRRDPRYGRMGPHHGQPAGHLPVTSYLAVPVRTRAGEVLGGLFFGHPEPAVFSERSERLAVSIAALAAIAMDNARMYQAARDADRRKDEYVATLAHELRNPLAPLRIGVDLLLRTPPERERIDKVGAMMRRQLNQVVRLIDDLLDVSRISLGKVTLQTAPVEVARAIQVAVETSKPALDARGHRLTVSLPPASCWMDADATRLAQIFANLLHNAAKFTPSGGHVQIHAACESGWVEIRVTDTGIGIPPAMLERIFEMFSQIEAPMQKTQPGLGIGLTLVRQLVELHGGTVRAESDGQGRGATLCVRMPLIVGAVDTAAARPDEPGMNGAPLRILVADDNVDAAEALGAALSFDGHDVRTVYAGREAVDQSRIFKPHAVLLDIGMPGMDGFEACRLIRAEPLSGAPRPLIVALTGWGQEEDRVRAQDAGFDHHLVKPAELAQLRALLMQLEPGGRT